MEDCRDLAKDTGTLYTNLEDESVDPDDVIMSVHVESEKDCELAVEVSGWRSERTREPRQGCEYKARDGEKRKKRRFDFGDLFPKS